jgi:hypothetical protein
MKGIRTFEGSSESELLQGVSRVDMISNPATIQEGSRVLISEQHGHCRRLDTVKFRLRTGRQEAGQDSTVGTTSQIMENYRDGSAGCH